MTQPIPNVKRRRAPEELRRAPRDLVDFGTRVIGHNGVHDVRIVNISPLGLMGRAAGAIAAGDKLMVELPHVQAVESVVRWVEDGRIGVEFLKGIAPDHYAMTLAFMPQRQCY